MQVNKSLEFMLEAQSHSGLPFYYSLNYALLANLYSDVDKFLNLYMQNIHKMHKNSRVNKNIKSYDW